MNLPLNPGIYPKLSMADYLAIPAVSASLLKAMLFRCPRAAWYESWLNPFKPAQDADSDDASDAGSIAHSILLEGNRSIMEVIDPALFPTKSSGNIPVGWSNKEIKAARDYARAQGKIPVLKDKAATIEAMVLSAQSFIESTKDSEPGIHAAFQRNGGQSEATIVWDEGGTLCKIRPDRMASKLIVDAKFSGVSAEPDGWGRTQLVRMGYYISAAWYQRGIKAALGLEPDYVFLVVETDPPHLCSLVGVDPHAMELGKQKVSAALHQWQACCERHQWPGYPARICYPEIPAWVDAEWIEKQVDDGIDYGSQG